MTHKTFDLAELLTMGLVSPKSDWRSLLEMI